MKLSNEAFWQEIARNNTDSYGRAVLQFAQTWAELMEQRMEAQETVESCFKPTADAANAMFGVTGAMVWQATQVLAECWAYGQQLKAAYEQPGNAGFWQPGKGVEAS